MELTDKEIKDLKGLFKANPVVEKVYLEYTLYKTDATRKFLLELNRMADFLTKEMENIREGRKKDCKLLTSDDKTFERIFMLITNSEKLFKGMRVAKEDISPDEAARMKSAEKQEKDDTIAL